MLSDGRILCIEVKAPKGRVSPHQQLFIDRINESNGKAFVARSIDDVERELQAYIGGNNRRGVARAT
ncbi:MAG: VRR-NUC domain-containing protein [Acidobacteriota bacterium]|nr:VRR-NUC domain-containing protein [Acidobacteriota bacterium]